MTTTTDLLPDSSPAAAPGRGATTGPAQGRRGAGAHEAYRLSFGRVLRSEWIKLRSLRGTWVGLLATLVVMIGIGAIASAVSTGDVSTPNGGGPPRGTGALDITLVGANFGVLLLGVIGCLAGAREYGSRMITATVAAVPRRWQVVASKATVLAAVVLPVSLVGVFGAFVTGMAIRSAGGSTTLGVGDDGVLRVLVGTGVYLTVLALIGFALGVLFRSAAASIGTLVGAVLILPGIAAALLPDSWQEILKFLPTNAAASFTTLTPPSGDLSATQGAIVLAAWLVAALGAATVAIRRRDV